VGGRSCSAVWPSSRAASAFAFIFPLFAKENGISNSEYGLIYSVGSLNMVLAIAPILALSRRGWDRRLIRGGPLVALLGMVVVLLAPGMPIGIWILGALLCGAAGSTFWVLSDPLLAEATEPATGRASTHSSSCCSPSAPRRASCSPGGPRRIDADPIDLSERGLRHDAGAALDVGPGPDLPVRFSPTGPGWSRVDAEAPTTGDARHRGFALTEVGFAFGYNSIRPFLSLFFTDRHDLSSGQAG
jgi:hypothetical protein